MKLFYPLVATLLCAPPAFAQHPDRTAGKPQVLFSGPPATQKTGDSATSHDKITDAERRGVAITAWDLDVHLAPAHQSLEAHARVTLKNAGTSPLAAIPLQLSSSLHFEDIGLRGKRLPFSFTTLASDADHTGKIVEAAIPLAEALPPGSMLTLDVDYGGTIPLTAQRLLSIGAPEGQAEATDWDRISGDFTGLRGYGNVLWYPVSSVPVSLGNGDTLFMEIGRQKLLDQKATMALRVTDEFTGNAPTAALLNGHYLALSKPAAMPTASFPGVVTCSLPATPLGFEAPSLFLVRRTETEGNGLRVLSTKGGGANGQDYITAAGLTAPLVHTWLGAGPHPLFTVLELPEPDDAPAETGEVLATPFSASSAQQVAPVVAHSLAHGAFWSRRAWLNEGVANFVSTLWFDSSMGHKAAMESLNASRPALAIAEPGSPGEGAGEDLEHAVSELYYRTKATYVLWMLRNMVGDKPLQAALQAYKPAEDTQPGYFQHLVEQASGQKLQWFFDDWVYNDRGLPDLSIGGVYSSAEAHQQTLVAVDIINDGYAAADVPLTVKGSDTSVTDWVRVPAHGRVTHRVLFQESPVEVDLNDGSIPEVQDSLHRKILKTASPAQ